MNEEALNNMEKSRKSMLGCIGIETYLEHVTEADGNSRLLSYESGAWMRQRETKLEWLSD